MEKNIIYQQRRTEKIKLLPNNSVDCCVTSPPYYGLRNYDNDPDQIGLEETPAEYVARIVEIMEEVRRVLKKKGTCWLNLGDTYCSTAPGSEGDGLRSDADGPFARAKDDRRASFKKKRPGTPSGMKPKDLIGIPWMVAFALRDAGWYLRQDIIWHKPNPMPESVTDRCTKSHEYIFLLSKSKKYYYDYKAIMQDAVTDENRPGGAARNRTMNYNSKENNNPDVYLKKASWKGSLFDKGKTGAMQDELRNGLLKPRSSGNKERKPPIERECPEGAGQNVAASVPWEGLKANKRSVWTVSTKPFAGAHFATYPEDLIVDCIKAGCPEGGIVLDPFFGAGTTGLVARKLNRYFIGYELLEKNIKLSKDRLAQALGMFM